MRTYFDKGKWELFAYEKLNQVIEQFKGNKNSYVIFDFDNTSAIHDIEDHLMVYMLDNFLYKITPLRLYEIMTTGPFDFNECVEGQVSVKDLADDVFELYKTLKKQALTLNELKETKEYVAFAAKIRAYYRYVNSNFVRQPGQPWLTYWFEGYTPKELQTLAVKMFEDGLNKEFKWRYWDSGDELQGKSGRIRSEFAQGLAFPKELIDLYQAFQAAGITTYIVSASPIDIVRSVSSHYGYNVPDNQIIAMEYQLDENGCIIAKMTETGYITKQEGKTEAIKALIMPKHNMHEPIAMFGDSMGDYHMMTHFHNTSLNVLFNCYHNDATQELAQLAVKQYGQRDAQIVLQGRDEPKGMLRPSQATIPLDSQEEVLLVK